MRKPGSKTTGGLTCLLFLTVVLMVIQFTPARAGVKWTINGPEGGPVNCFVSSDVTGTVIYAGCDGGVWKSVDAGEHWQFLANAPTRVTKLAINPIDTSVVYAGNIERIYKSADGGQTWSAVLSRSGTLTGLAVDPHVPQNVFVSYEAIVNGSGPLYRSTDAGATWTAVTPVRLGQPTNPIISIGQLVLDPFIPSTVYVGPSFCRSTDSGDTFTDLSAYPSPWFIYAPSDEQNVLYGTPPIFKSVGDFCLNHSIWRSNNAGDGWIDFGPDNLGCHESFVGCMVSHQGIGYAVLIGTLGDGVIKGYFPYGNWDRVNNGLGNGLHWLNIKDLTLHVPVGAFAALDSGVYRTDVLEPGADWHAKNLGLSNAVVSSLALAKDPQHTVYAGTSGGGIFKSADNGQSWQPINQGITQLIPYSYQYVNKVAALAVEWPKFF